MTSAASAALRVNFDAQIFSAQAYGGISRYVASLATALAQLPQVEPCILAPFHCNYHLDDVPSALRHGRRSTDTPTPGHRIASLLGSAWMQWRRPADILHRTYYYPVPRPSSRTPTVLTVHDMIHERFADSYTPNDPIARWKRRAIRSADAVLCVSENTRRDLLAHHPELAPDQVFVTPLGFDGWAAARRGASEGFDQPSWPYLLFVGNRHGYKNFAGLLAAYRSSPWLQENFGLLCFGGGAFSPSELAAFAQLRNPERVRHCAGSDALLVQCYRHAALFVYPSLYEGFGLPPLEAMAMDCPIACSNTSSIPEVVGDAGAYFDPAATDAIRDVLERVLQSPELRDALVQRGRQRRSQFSWRRCALATLAAYQTTLAT